MSSILKLTSFIPAHTRRNPAIAKAVAVLERPITPALFTKPQRKKSVRKSGLILAFKEKREARKEAKSDEVREVFDVTDAVTLYGKLKAGNTTMYSLESKDLLVDENTWVFGTLALGATARVEAVKLSERQWRAVKVRIDS